METSFRVDKNIIRHFHSDEATHFELVKKACPEEDHEYLEHLSSNFGPW
jgi:hypothetical protein